MTEDAYSIIRTAMGSLQRIKFKFRGESIIAEPHFAYMDEIEYCMVKLVTDSVNKKAAYPIGKMINTSVLPESFVPDMAFYEYSKDYKVMAWVKWPELS